MSKPSQTIYYTDLLNDEFSTAQITPKVIDENWIYIHTTKWKRFTHFFWLNVVAKPLAFCYLKHKFHHKLIGKEKLKATPGTGFFLYGNHTQPVADALMPTMICKPNDAYVIVHPNNVSMPFLGRVTPSMGALPLPGNALAARNFMQAVSKRIEEGHPVCIYPEAHIWPYYTGIRPFKDDSFAYPIKEDVPVYCFTNTYQLRRNPNKVKLVTYVDGPFFAPVEGTRIQKRQALRETVYRTMCERAKMSEVEHIHYLPKESTQND